MPKGRARKASTSTSGSDSGPNDPTPPKKTKVEEKKKPASSSAKGDEGGEDSWEIGRNRFVKLTDFKGRMFVDVREFYMDNSGDMKPGKKGIMLTMEQWAKFREIVPELDAAVKRRV